MRKKISFRTKCIVTSAISIFFVVIILSISEFGFDKTLLFYSDWAIATIFAILGGIFAIFSILHDILEAMPDA